MTNTTYLTPKKGQGYCKVKIKIKGEIRARYLEILESIKKGIRDSL